MAHENFSNKMEEDAAHDASALPTPSRDRQNWYIHLLFVGKEYGECLRVIEEQLTKSGGMCDYALYVKGMIFRMEGRVQESLSLFQAAALLKPTSTDHLKQVGRCLFLLGKHKAAIDVFDEAMRLDPEDWETHHLKGACYVHLRQYSSAVECFEAANSISRHDATFLQLGKVLALQDDVKGALSVYGEALEFSPESVELLTAAGLAYLRLGDALRAFEHLGGALTHDPRNARAIMGAGSIIQDNRDADVALVKYRVAAVQVWRHLAAAACLKRALYLDPFEWIVAHNLGLVHLASGQARRSFWSHKFFSTAANLKPNYAPAYMYMGVALARLDDFENACAAYDRAVQIEEGASSSSGGGGGDSDGTSGGGGVKGGSGDYLTRLNYAVSLANNDERERAKEQLLRCRELFAKAEKDVEHDEDAVVAAVALAATLGVEWAPP
ncbi:unnamed protein product [Phaeothamnion confervicola]